MLRGVFAAILLFSSIVGTIAGGRVALVVGVSNYEHAGRLPSTLNDAQDMAAALKRLGFDVEMLLDPSRSALESAVRRYGDRSVGAEVSLFHYSGHALESAGRNWLLPATASLANERDLRFEAIDLNTIHEQADGAAKVSIVFLDACRDNPFARRLSVTRRDLSPRGLARVDVALGGVLVAFSTGPGQVALDSVGTKRNSPFTAALLKHIETPGLEIKSLLARVTKDVVEETKGTQRPWQNSSLEGDFYFLPPPVVAAVSSAQSLVTLDSMFWDSIKTSQNPADFKAYLARFPKGVFVDLAQNRLATLQHDIMPNVGPANTPQVPPPPAVQPQQLASPGSSPPTTSFRDRGQTDGLIGRARALIGVGDIISARIALRHAYELGDARAALELGGTYDPVMLKRLNVTLGNSYADAVQAHDWYVRAAELGSIDAIHRMKQLSLENR
ncbi:MAG TPA: caspase family protein [Xanthobacteraceae bacterium]|nr:caspase family protein [Xanthobacteraceae bacterium]